MAVAADERSDVQRAPTCQLLVAPSREHRRGAMRNHADLVVRARAQPDEEAARRFRHHHDTLGLAAQRRQHLELMRLWFREQRVKCHDERLRKLARERQHVFAVETAEDPVLVLQQDDVDIHAAEQPGRSDIVAPDRLRHRRQYVRSLRTRRLVDDHDRAGMLDSRHVD